jgi:hypothetical protein
MIRRTVLVAALAGAALAATAFAPAASARTAWSVSIGAPGFYVSAGEPYVRAPYRTHWRHHHYRDYYAPPVVYAPRHRHYYAPPRVVYRPAYVAPPVVYRPYYPY